MAPSWPDDHRRTSAGPAHAHGRGRVGGTGLVSVAPVQRRAGSPEERTRVPRQDEPKDDVISKAAAMAVARRGKGGPAGDAGQFIRQYYRHVALEDLAERAEVDVYGAAMSQYRLAGQRPQGTANVRAFTPTVAEHGWSAEGHTVVEVVTDDMSFLVDSVTMQLNEEGRGVH